jgi:hypothetical protein
MRFLGACLVLSLAVAPALAEPVTYTFNVSSGNEVWNIYGAWGQLSASSPMTGTFAVTLSNGHVTPGDTFILENGNLQNTQTMSVTPLFGDFGLMYFGQYVTGSVAAGDAKFLDFGPLQGDPANGPQPGGTIGVGPTSFSSDTWLSGYITFTGVTSGTQVFPPTNYQDWAKYVEPFSLTLSEADGIITANLTGLVLRDLSGGSLGYLDFAFSAEGTAQAVPEPTLCGLATLVLGAGAWMRRRTA